MDSIKVNLAVKMSEEQSHSMNCECRRAYSISYANRNQRLKYVGWMIPETLSLSTDHELSDLQIGKWQQPVKFARRRNKIHKYENIFVEWKDVYFWRINLEWRK